MTYSRDRRRKQQRRANAVQYDFIDPNDPAMRRSRCTCRTIDEYLENHRAISQLIAAPNPLLTSDRSRPWPDVAVR